MNQQNHDKPSLFQQAYQIYCLPNRPRRVEALAQVKAQYGEDWAQQVELRVRELFQRNKGKASKLPTDSYKGNLSRLIED